jgi:hypothetical protein
MWFFIYTLAFGILSAISASNKNRNPFIWFFIGLIFGIFGFIASLIVSDLNVKNNNSSEINEKNEILKTDNNKLEKLSKLNELLEKKRISEDEFNKLKKEILN